MSGQRLEAVRGGVVETGGVVVVGGLVLVGGTGAALCAPGPPLKPKPRPRPRPSTASNAATPSCVRDRERKNVRIGFVNVLLLDLKRDLWATRGGFASLPSLQVPSTARRRDPAAGSDLASLPPMAAKNRSTSSGATSPASSPSTRDGRSHRDSPPSLTGWRPPSAGAVTPLVDSPSLDSSTSMITSFSTSAQFRVVITTSLPKAPARLPSAS